VLFQVIEPRDTLFTDDAFEKSIADIKMIRNFSKDFGYIVESQHCQYSAHVAWGYPKDYLPLFCVYKNLSDSDKLDVIYLIMNNLQILHKNKMVHGNLNPWTVFLSQRSPYYIYMTSYGLSRISSSLSQQQMVYQTFEGIKPPNEKSDCYSLAKIIELLSIGSSFQSFFSNLSRFLLNGNLKSALDQFKNPPQPIKVLDHSFSPNLYSKLPPNEFNAVYQYVLNEAQHNNNSYAQLALGLKFKSGFNPYITKNKEEAMKYFRAAMKNGNLKAKFSLAKMLSQENEQSKLRESFSLFGELENQGYIGASYYLGFLYRKANDNQNASTFFNKEFQRIGNKNIPLGVLLELCKTFLSNDFLNIPKAEQCLQKYHQNIQRLNKRKKNRRNFEYMLKDYNKLLKHINKLKTGGMITSESDADRYSELSDNFSDDSSDIFSSDSEEF